MPNVDEVLQLLVEADRAQQGPPPDSAALWAQVTRRLDRDAPSSTDDRPVPDSARVIVSKEHEMSTQTQHRTRTWPPIVVIGAATVALVAVTLAVAGLRQRPPGVTVDAAAGVPDVVSEDLAAVSAGDVDRYLAVRTPDSVIVDEIGATRPADAPLYLDVVAQAPVMGLRFTVEGCQPVPPETDDMRVTCTIVATDVLHRAFGTVAIEHDVLYGIRDGRISRTNELAAMLARSNEDGMAPLLRTGLHAYLLREDPTGYANACASDYTAAPTPNCVTYLQDNIDAYLQGR